jgi:hypothetical protein
MAVMFWDSTDIQGPRVGFNRRRNLPLNLKLEALPCQLMTPFMSLNVLMVCSSCLRLGWGLPGRPGFRTTGQGFPLLEWVTPLEQKLRRQICLFCDRQAGSREHLWAAWIHQRMRRREAIRITFANRPIAISKNPEITVKTVCGICNNGWMSDLEAQCIPLIGSLMQDISAPLDTSQQSLLAAWALKTAMVLDSTNPRERQPFYERDECEKLRLSSKIPDRTRVWIGRSSLNGLHADSTDIGIVAPGGTKIAKGSATTLIVGHLAVQVLAVHPLPEYEDKTINEIAPRPGPWDDLLVQIWPANSRSTIWPPRLTFTGSGTRQHIGQLLYRWRIGKRASEPIT